MKQEMSHIDPAAAKDASQKPPRITHSEFKSGLNTTIGYFLLDASFAVRGTAKLFFNVYVGFYMIAPLIIVPLFALRWHTWEPLLAIVASYAGSFIAARTRYRHFFLVVLTALSAGSWLWIAFHSSFSLRVWLAAGLHSVLIFNCLLALWGLMWFLIADGAQEQFAIDALLDSPELYDEAVAQDKIEVFRFQEMGAAMAQRVLNKTGKITQSE